MSADPAGECSGEPGQELGGFGVLDGARVIEPVADAAEVSFGLAHGGHVEVGEGLPQVVVGAKAADGTNGGADDGGR